MLIFYYSNIAMITKRQERILNSIIEEYVKSAQPVSSHLLEGHKSFDVSPATLRNEMQKLTDLGFLKQPHTSAGRMPTDKGYRFYVNSFLDKDRKEIDFKLEEEDLKDAFKLMGRITRDLAVISSSLALGYLAKEKILLKEGWEGIIREPEFKEENFTNSFVKFLKAFEKEIEDDSGFESGLNIFIGRENPFLKTEEFSIIVSRCRFPDKKEGILAITGPTRMPYGKSINSLDSLTKLLEEF